MPILNSMMEMKIVPMYNLNADENVDVSGHYDAKVWYGAEMRNVLILDLSSEMKTVFTYKMNVGEKVNGQYKVKMWYRIQKIRESSDAIFGIYEIWNRTEIHYGFIIDSISGMNTVSAYNLNVGENVCGRYDVKVRYRNQIRKSSDALYGIYEIW